MPGGTNLPVLAGPCRGSQTPYPYDAYPPQAWIRINEAGDVKVAGLIVFPGCRTFLPGVSSN